MGGDPAKSEDLVFRVDPHWDGFRLDHYLRAMRPSISRSKIQRFIRADLVRVDGDPRPANWKVRTGNEVRLTPNFPGEDLEAGRRISLEILHEDEDLVVVNKPAGLHVHPVTGHRHDTLLNALYWRYREAADEELAEDTTPTLAHRLDRDTSGVIVAARHRAAREFLQGEFEARRPRKTYFALVRGQVADDAGRIDFALAPASDPRAREKMLVVPASHPEAKPSATRYRVLDRHAPRAGLPEGYSTLELDLETGRQHQIRVHCAALGHPLLADDRYGEAGPVEIAEGGVIGRVALHARRLVLRHPRDGVEQTFEAPLPPDLTLPR